VKLLGQAGGPPPDGGDTGAFVGDVVGGGVGLGVGGGVGLGVGGGVGDDGGLIGAATGG